MKHTPPSENTSTAHANGRCPSGVEGLDDILAGGLPRDCFYLVQGDPGSGKTTLALQFLQEGLPGEKYLHNQLHELTSYLNQQGVVTIMILAQHGLVAAAQAPVDLSYLSDTVVCLRYFEAAGEVKQSLSVIKKRSGHHEKTIREFKLESGKGIRVGKPLKEFQGVLTGVPVFHGTDGKMMSTADARR